MRLRGHYTRYTGVQAGRVAPHDARAGKFLR